MERNKITFFVLLIMWSTSLAIAQNKTTHAIDRFVQKYMGEKKIPGCAIAILKDNTIVKFKGYGLASIEFNAPVTTGTKFLLDLLVTSKKT